MIINRLTQITTDNDCTLLKFRNYLAEQKLMLFSLMTCQVHTYFIPKRVVDLYIILLRDFETNRNEILARAEKLG